MTFLVEIERERQGGNSITGIYVSRQRFERQDKVRTKESRYGI